MNTSVPTYIKNILHVCGYNNGISIASIREEDFEYLETEVKNGNVTKYFVGKEAKEVLEGSTKDVDEFTRGHKTFLRSIIDFLKNHMKENGPDSFKPNKKPMKTPKKNCKITNRSTVTLNESPGGLAESDLNVHRGMLICKTMMSLINLTPELYAMVSLDFDST